MLIDQITSSGAQEAAVQLVHVVPSTVIYYDCTNMTQQLVSPLHLRTASLIWGILAQNIKLKGEMLLLLQHYQSVLCFIQYSSESMYYMQVFPLTV